MTRPQLVNTTFVAVVLLGFFATTSVPAEGGTETCTRKFKGQRPTDEELQKVLKLHAEWVLLAPKERTKNEGKKADLCGASLVGSTDLRGANLSGANLSGARLISADLSEADLSDADLSGADLGSARLISADLSEANLSGASLTWAHLSGANLLYANLSEVDLKGADLASARFGLLYAGTGIVPGTKLPTFEKWDSARNLSQVRLHLNAETMAAFERLREDFKKNGMRPEERGVTAALQWAQSRNADLLEHGFRFLAFDLTSEYGNSPERSLMILLLGILLFTLPYTRALMLKSHDRRGAIWMVWNEDRILDIASDEHDRKKRERLSGLAFPKALVYGLYFSILSAFHFGWRDLNVGNWISRIQPREYVLRATGWVRAVSGVQSFLSVYLVALWALTYFGRPFE
jgi:uncharacterized protein YjbI with pentapeptide repeats